jgi:hypothetical protein
MLEPSQLVEVTKLYCEKKAPLLDRHSLEQVLLKTLLTEMFTLDQFAEICRLLTERASFSHWKQFAEDYTQVHMTEFTPSQLYTLGAAFPNNSRVEEQMLGQTEWPSLLQAV